MVDDGGTPRLAVLRGQVRQRGVDLVPAGGGAGDGSAVVQAGSGTGGGLSGLDQLREQEQCRLLHRAAARKRDVGEASAAVVGEHALGAYLKGEPEVLPEHPGQFAALAGQHIPLGVGQVLPPHEGVLHQLAAQRPPWLLGEQVGGDQFVGVRHARQRPGEHVRQHRPVDGQQRLVAALAPAGRRTVRFGQHTPTDEVADRGHQRPALRQRVADLYPDTGRVGAHLVDQRRDEGLLAGAGGEQRGAQQRQVGVGRRGEGGVVRAPRRPGRPVHAHRSLGQPGKRRLHGQAVAEQGLERAAERRRVQPHQRQLLRLPGGEQRTCEQRPGRVHPLTGGQRRGTDVQGAHAIAASVVSRPLAASGMATSVTS